MLQDSIKDYAQVLGFIERFYENVNLQSKRLILKDLGK